MEMKMPDQEGSQSYGRTPTRNIHRTFFDPDNPVALIGHGSIGGKAKGLVLAHEILRQGLNPSVFPGIRIDIPAMAILGTDVFTTFIQRNNLDEITRSNIPDHRITAAFQRADLPFEVLGDLRLLVSQVRIPLAIRSSSLLEDTERSPFAGVYATKMIPNSQFDPDIRFRQLAEAIKFVYASTFYQAAKNYRRAVGLADKDEKMAVIIQEMVGKRYHERFYPEVSGVARSINYYPMAPARPDDGVVSLALGLGKTIVDGGICWTYSPAFPKIGPPFGSVENLLDETQVEFWAVAMGEPRVSDPTLETEYMQLENIAAAEKDGALRLLASTYDAHSGRLSIGVGMTGPRALTFAPLLVLKLAPLNDLVVALRSLCEKSLGGPVEIEFAMTLDPHRFSLLQMRKIAGSDEKVEVKDDEFSESNILVASHTALGNGLLNTVRDVVYVKPEAFDLKYTQMIVPVLKQINKKLLTEGRPYLLIALGRLGTTDPWLGIPIQWGQVSGAKAVVEATYKNVKVELSQGSHYFHNIINLGVKYFLLPHNGNHRIDWDWLDQQEIIEDTRFVRHIRLPQPLVIMVDGCTSRGVVLKPEESSL